MDLTSVRIIKKLCGEYGIRPSKDMGQNFLISQAILAKIVEAGELSSKDAVLEIGPGFGILTQELVARAGRVVSVEKDKRLAEYLSKEIGKLENLEIRNKDILRLKIEDLRFQNYKIISNLPYQITSPFLWKFLYEEDLKPGMMVLMIQKEVADKIVAKPGDKSLLTVLCQYYAECEIISVVKAGSFWPAPKVDSAIIKLKIKNEKLNINENLLFRIVKAGFSNKRKMLKNNLSSVLKISQDKVINSLKQIGLDEKIRAQELSIENWIELHRALS